MTVFPRIDDKGICFALKVEFSGEATGDGEIGVVSEGAGAFVIIKCAGEFRLNTSDLREIADWADRVIKEMDEIHGEGK